MSNKKQLKTLAEQYDLAESIYTNLDEIGETDAAGAADILRDKIWDVFRDRAAEFMFEQLTKEED